jgi:NAD(P)H dehydrogenase (quinone)
MKKIFLVYGHYNDASFNAAIRDEFIKTSKEKGNQVDVVDLYKEKFNPVFAGEEPDKEVLDHRRYFAVPFVGEEKRKEFLKDVRETANNV